MKPRSQLGTGGVIALVLVVAGLAFYALRTTRTEVGVDGGPEITIPEDGSAVVDTLLESGGFSLFGIRFSDSTRSVGVKFLAGPGCSQLIASGDPWPAPYPECASAVPVAGEVGGTGVTMSGDSIVVVRFEVSRACFDRLERGMPWPPDVAECRSGS